MSKLLISIALISIIKRVRTKLLSGFQIDLLQEETFIKLLALTKFGEL